ncbi:MAG TPA: hypothetical protein VLU41_01305 [Ideonella sp.]|nr:hypothetical protein [Ideonella sp.]
MSLSLRAGAVAFAATLLASCGGGDGGGSLVTPIAEDTVPAGPRIDVSALDLFPLDAGDDWTYDLFFGAQAGGTVTRKIVAGPDANGWFTLRESGATQSTDVFYRQTSEGIEQFDPLGAQQSMPGAYRALPAIVQYPMPFYAPGGVRRVVRQGDALADLDGDGFGDAFRVEITQVFRGFEAQDVLGQPAQVAHFSTALAFTIFLSASGSSYTTTTTEEGYLASGLGLVRADRAATGSDGAVIVEPYTLTLRDAAIAPLP